MSEADAMLALCRAVFAQLTEAMEHGSISGVLAASRQLQHLGEYDPRLAAVAFAAACEESETNVLK